MNKTGFNPVEMRTDDRLKAGLDKALFFVIFAVGAALIVAAKLGSTSKWLPAVIGAVSILLFCAIGWVTPRYRLREDRLGDSAYYLGFLFTLVSLAITLYQFTALGGVEIVISGFGIALATTIVGLALRVFFQQLRDEPMEVEQEIRRSLRDDADQLQRDIRQCVEGLSALRDRVNLEMAQTVGDGLKEILKDSRSAMVDQLKVFRTSIESTLGGVHEAVLASTNQAAETRKATSRLLKAIDTLAEKIEQTRSPTDGFRDKIDEFTGALDRMLKREAERIEKNRQSSDAILSVYRDMETRAVEAASAMEQCKAAVEGMQTAVGQSSTIARELTERAAQAMDALLERNHKHLELLTRVEQESKASETFLRSLRTDLESQVQMSAGALSALERNVLQATEMIVKALSAR